MQGRPHPRRWAAGAIASRVGCQCRGRGDPPQDDWSYWCDSVWASPQKKHLHDRACATGSHGQALGRSSLAGRPSTMRAPSWLCSWPCDCVGGSCRGATSMRWRIARRSRHSEVRSVATECSRRQTTPVVDWSNDTLSDEHGQAADFRVERRGFAGYQVTKHQQLSKRENGRVAESNTQRHRIYYTGYRAGKAKRKRWTPTEGLGGSKQSRVGPSPWYGYRSGRGGRLTLEVLRVHLNDVRSTRGERGEAR